MKFNSHLQTSFRSLRIILTLLLTIIVVCDTIHVNISSVEFTNQNETSWSVKETEGRTKSVESSSVSNISDTTVSSIESTLSVATISQSSKSSSLITTKTNDNARHPIASTTSSVTVTQRFFSTSFEGTSTSTLISLDLQSDPTSNSSTVETNSSVNSKNLTLLSSSEDDDNNINNSLQWHIYVFGMSFALLGGLTFYTLIHHIVCLTLSRRGYLMVSNMLLCLVCLLRTLYMFNLEAKSSHSTAYQLLVYESPTFLLQSTMMCFVGGLGIYTETQWLKTKAFNHSLPVNILVLPYIAVTLSCVVVLTAVDDHLDQTNRRCLHQVLKAVSAIWAATVASTTCFLYKRIYKASMRRQSQIIRVTLTKLHIEGTQLPKKLPKPCLCLSAKAALLTCILSLIMCIFLVIGIIFSYDVLLTIGHTIGLRWLYENMLRFCEVLMCLSLSCGLFWSQCGHPCRRLVGNSTSSNLWSTLRKHSTIWHAPAESLRRFSDRRRHSSDEGYNCHGMFGIYGTTSSHAVARTNFTFERWERTRRPVPLPNVSDVPLATDGNFSTMPPPILKTFQHGGSCRISPQHILQSSQMALQRTRRTVSTTVAAGIRSLSRSNRSSSSSISSASSVRPSPSKGLTLPSIKQEEINEWNNGDRQETDGCENGRSEHHYAAKTKFNKRFFGSRRIECENRIHKSHVPSDKQLTYVKKKPPSSVRRKPRHLESGKRKVKELANKVLMVSRATQVYIPSPHKYSLECDDANSVVYHSQRDERIDATTTTTGRRTFPHTEMPHSNVSRRCWLQFGGGSSTSCSSESAGNSFDVRFYMYSPGSHCRDVSPSSTNHDFHEQYYCSKLNSGRPRSSLDVSCDSTDNGRSDVFTVPHNVFEMPRTQISCGVDADDSLSNSSQDHSLDLATVVAKQHKLRYFLPRFRKTSKVDKRAGPSSKSGDISNRVSAQKERIDTSFIDHCDGTTSTFNLSLPLEKDTYKTVCQTSKNHQDITPDSAVYLELNLPENENEDEEQTMAKHPHIWLEEPNSVLGLRKSISLTSLYKEADKHQEKTISTRRLSLIGFQGEESSLIQAPVLYSASTATNKETYKCCAMADQKMFVQGASSPWKAQLHQEAGTGFMSSSDSVYDSGDESSVVSLENCSRYKQIDFQELTNF